ncbi:MAG TPA: hypothetical protein VJA82_11475 [Sediminibacterium sp.]|uniref:hypothetical protein n=1 Tax=Sediminibacterium sp. TaxID=1917865 RepID=UPI0008D82563|nr:hypothetical protein [Sediminibacterium sp.]MDP1974137.1 hypothetical protein [Sediminibacterium sp.]OHC84307.1 MAG: hypothetical protein A2472_12670 [Sphingobacteriia bacterium RIFOXYC2_FULL_35_18]OHC88745.1 MAG: hypothetical protein A2546_02510 [Sphingobacteriia bacterium RIFOXYD2_FULL_35_12]HLD53918.1 hypothetical protein [Sediminibacterium sp.]
MEEKLRVVFISNEQTFDSDKDDFSEKPLSDVYSMAHVVFRGKIEEILEKGWYVLVDSDESGKPTHFRLVNDNS